VLEDAESRILAETQDVRVTEWRLRHGTHTGQHVHGYDYSVMPVSGGRLTVTDAAGQATAMEQVRGTGYSRPAGVEHDVANIDDPNEVVFVEVELLRG
jgi:quercetin dioxygenase-like cupin family protein